jgi:hypothetical protein
VRFFGFFEIVVVASHYISATSVDPTPPKKIIPELYRRVLSCSGNIFFENYSPLAGAAFLIMPASGLPCLAKAVS